LNSFIPAIKFSSVGAIGFVRCGAFRAAAESSARCANAFSNALGVAFAFVGSHPSQAAANAPTGIVSIPATNPSRNLRITPPAIFRH
jgi:hypothetical protein